MLLGERIKELRAEHGVLQRQLAALLEIDTPMFSKIERGDRRAKRTQVIQLAEYFNIDKNYNRGIQMYRFPNSDVQKSVIFEGIKKRLKIV